jgi:hypothetical protein
MANYTKRELRKIEVARAFAASQRPTAPQPICECGEPAAVEVNRPPRVTFYCVGHLAEAETAFASRG